jgi:hypothetical protein
MIGRSCSGLSGGVNTVLGVQQCILVPVTDHYNVLVVATPTVMGGTQMNAYLPGLRRYRSRDNSDCGKSHNCKQR